MALNAGQILETLKGLIAQGEAPAADPPAPEPPAQTEANAAPPPAAAAPIDYAALAAALVQGGHIPGGQTPPVQGAQQQGAPAPAPAQGVQSNVGAGVPTPPVATPPPGAPPGAGGGLAALIAPPANPGAAGVTDYTDEAQVKALIQQVGIHTSEWRDKHHPKVAKAISDACDAAGGPANYLPQGKLIDLPRRRE